MARRWSDLFADSDVRVPGVDGVQKKSVVGGVFLKVVIALIIFFISFGVPYLGASAAFECVGTTLDNALEPGRDGRCVFVVIDKVLDEMEVVNQLACDKWCRIDLYGPVHEEVVKLYDRVHILRIWDMRGYEWALLDEVKEWSKRPDLKMVWSYVDRLIAEVKSLG